jgi:hypothetical protein
MKLHGTELRAACAKVRAYKIDGKTDEEIAELLGLPWPDYEALARKFYDQESQDIRERSTEAVYVDYVLDQGQNIRDLTGILSTFKETKQHSAMVGAIRARSEIQDKIISRGQEFGFIEKRPDTKLVVGGIAVMQMSDKELRSAVTEELQHLSSLQHMFGGALESPIIDVEVGELHQDTPKQKSLEPLVPRRKKAAAKGK